MRSLGKIGEREAENEVILLEHDVPHSKFSDEVLACLPKETWTISASVSVYNFFNLYSICSYQVCLKLYLLWYSGPKLFCLLYYLLFSII